MKLFRCTRLDVAAQACVPTGALCPPSARGRRAAPSPARLGSVTRQSAGFQRGAPGSGVVGTPRHRAGSAAAVSDLEQQGQAAAYEPDALSMFLGWLVSNGVEGLGTEQSKLSMYESESGERGFLNTQPIKAGEVLLRVPLRLALTSFEGDEDNALMYEGAPWSVRLSAKLLRELRMGQAAPRWPYLQVLPKQVPAPLETFSWEEMQQIQYSVGQAKLFQYQWLVADAYARCSSEALGGASEEQFQWAMSIVHSRTFGNASKSGGVGVHMLVPLVDMFNHGGDETASGLLSDPQRVPTDNVRWDVVQVGDVWEMVVTATADVEDSGNQLLLSYGERCSDDFFLHYGFVPEGNPHESVQLFEDLTEALDWHHHQYATLVPVNGVEKLYRSALAEAQAEQLRQKEQQRAAQPPRRPPPPSDGAAAGGAHGPDPEHEVLLHAGGQVDAALMLAFGRVSGLDSRTAEAEVSRHCLQALRARCLELLEGLPSSLLQDVAALWADATVKGDEDTAAKQLDLLNHYRQELHRQGLLPPLSAPGPAASSSSGSEMPIEAFAWQTYLSIPPQTAAEQEGGEPVAPAPAQGAALGQLSSVQQLLHRYRLNKKMVLWDAVLATGVALAAATLAQAEAQADKAAAA